jgi:tetratricopeptide (TPR) repeat protein
MRTTVLALVAALVIPCTLSAQGGTNASATAQLANRHYKQGWSAMHAESYDEAAREFQQAIDADPQFKYAYYSLGRAEMARHGFVRAIAAYTRCRELYLAEAGQQFTDKQAARRHLEDRILEEKAALQEATNQNPNINTQTTNNLYIRELQAKINQLEQARDHNVNVSIDQTLPFFVPLALGAAYFRSGRMADAEREYKAAIAIQPNAGEAFQNLAVLYLVTERYADAERALAAAKKTGFKVNPALEQEVKEKKKG